MLTWLGSTEMETWHLLLLLILKYMLQLHATSTTLHSRTAPGWECDSLQSEALLMAEWDSSAIDIWKKLGVNLCYWFWKELQLLALHGIWEWTHIDDHSTENLRTAACWWILPMRILCCICDSRTSRGVANPDWGTVIDQCAYDGHIWCLGIRRLRGCSFKL